MKHVSPNRSESTAGFYFTATLLAPFSHLKPSYRNSIWLPEESKMAYRRRGERQGSKRQAASKDDEKPSTRSQPCRQFLRGNCHYGATCRFSHDKSVALDRRPETGANEASEAREAYFDFKRRLKQINSSLFLGAHAPLANVWR